MSLRNNYSVFPRSLWFLRVLCWLLPGVAFEQARINQPARRFQRSLRARLLRRQFPELALLGRLCRAPGWHRRRGPTPTPRLARREVRAHLSRCSGQHIKRSLLLGRSQTNEEGDKPAKDEQDQRAQSPHQQARRSIRCRGRLITRPSRAAPTCGDIHSGGGGREFCWCRCGRWRRRMRGCCRCWGRAGTACPG